MTEEEHRRKPGRPSACHYPHTIGVIRDRLLAAFPAAEPVRGANDDVSNTLWLIEQVSLLYDQGKVDRWIGWIGAKAHSLGLIDQGDNDLSEGRSLIVEDLRRAGMLR